jgi:hypothetical protein
LHKSEPTQFSSYPKSDTDRQQLSCFLKEKTFQFAKEGFSNSVYAHSAHLISEKIVFSQQKQKHSFQSKNYDS